MIFKKKQKAAPEQNAEYKNLLNWLKTTKQTSKISLNTVKLHRKEPGHYLCTVENGYRVETLDYDGETKQTWENNKKLKVKLPSRHMPNLKTHNGEYENIKIILQNGKVDHIEIDKHCGKTLTA